MNKPKLLILTSSYYPHIGGVERHVREVAKRLQRNYRVLIVVRYASDMPSHQVVDGIRIIRLPERLTRTRLAVWSVRHWTSLAGTAIVHSHDLFIHFFMRLLLQAYWVHTFHGYEGYPIAKSAIKTRQAIRASVKYCFGVGKFIEKWYGTKCDEYLYGAADSSQLPVSQTIAWDGIYFGRLEADTGFRAYLEAMVELGKSNPKLKFAVLGDGSELAWAKKYAQDRAVTIEFLGQQPKVFEFLAKAKLAFVSGYLGIIEAAAMARPIIAYYDNPLKKDYLESHPQAEAMSIVDSVAAITNAFTKSRQVDPTVLKDFETWARKQTWENIVDLYERAYAQRTL